MQQSTEYKQKTVKYIILSYETQPALGSLFTACLQWYELWRQHVYISCWQSVTAGNHSLSSVWPAENISPLQHKLLHADFNLDHPGIQDLNLLLLLLLLLLHWTTAMGWQAYQLQKSCKTESVNILYTQAKYTVLTVSDSYHLSLPVANLPRMWVIGCVS